MHIAFTLRKQQYVVPYDEVQEVILLPDFASETPSIPVARTLSKLPWASLWLIGITNLHGRPLPLIDLAVLLGFPQSKSSEKKWVLILEMDNIFCGLIVDGVQGVRQVDRECYRNSIPGSLPEPLHYCLVGSYCDQQEYLALSFKALIDSQVLKSVSTDVVI